MPELPEVETIRGQLAARLPLQVEQVRFSSVVGSILKEQEFQLEGLTLRPPTRIGKMLIFLAQDAHGRKQGSVFSHLGMSGAWLITDEFYQTKHFHLQIQGRQEGGRGLVLAYFDPRRFGKMYWLTAANEHKVLGRIGVDIASSDFTYEYLRSVLKRYPQRQIKPFLLDQKFFAGSGNYMANEICARAGVRPTRRAKTLTRQEARKMVEVTATVIKGGLETGGVTFSGGHRDTSGNPGQGLKGLVVFYQKTCQLCRQSTVKKITLAQRGTYYCPRCQR